MLHNKIQNHTKDFVPICHSSFFRNNEHQKFIQISTCKSFSKSNEKKLKLINDSRSLQKSEQFEHQKRKIKPLRLKVDNKKSQQSQKQAVCSIKTFKTKINKITQDSVIKSKQKLATSNTEVSQNHESNIFKTFNSTNTTQRFFGSNGTSTSLTQIADPFPTLGSSLVINQGIFTPQGLLQSVPNSASSNQTISFPSPKYNFIQSETYINIQTPTKQKLSNEQKEISTKQKTEKNERLTLSMARRVQTHETLKTENDICHSVVEENEYKKFFDNLAFPDYFSPKNFQKVTSEKENQNFKFYIQKNELQ